jgi:hypothetical protein
MKTWPSVFQTSKEVSEGSAIDIDIQYFIFKYAFKFVTLHYPFSIIQLKQNRLSIIKFLKMANPRISRLILLCIIPQRKNKKRT